MKMAFRTYSQIIIIYIKMHHSVCILIPFHSISFVIVLHNKIFWHSTSFVYCLVSCFTRYSLAQSIQMCKCGYHWQQLHEAKTYIQYFAEENWYVIWFCANEKMENNLQFKFYIFETFVDFIMLKNRI